MPLRQTRWLTFGALAGGIVIVAALWFIVLSDPKGEARPASGGRYVEGVTGRPERLNPLFARPNSVEGDVSSLVFSGLVRLSPDGTPQPDLAERWEILGLGATYVFHLRHGIAWQDDARTPFTADDVVFTYNAIGDPAFKGDPTLAQVMQGVVVTARDAYTVEFRLEQPYGPFLSYLTVGILPEHLLKGLDANQLFNAEFNGRPIGTGPYRFRRATPNSIELETNSTYYLGPPKISSFEFRLYDNADDLSGAIRKGEVDGALLPADAPAAEVDFLRGDGRFSLHDLTGTSMLQVYLKLSLPQFEEADVRQALFRAINRQALIDEVAHGRGATADVGIPRASWAYTQQEVPAFDPGEAARILESAGWQRGRDGVRRKGATRLAFTISTSNDPERVAVAENVAQQLRAAGADVQVQAIDAATFVEGTLLRRDFQAALAEIDPGPDPDPYPFWHSHQIASPGRNLSGYDDPRVDEALERGRSATEVQRRKELYQLFAGYLLTAMPALPLYAPAQTYIQNTRVQGFESSLLFTDASRFANVTQWYVKTRVR